MKICIISNKKNDLRLLLYYIRNMIDAEIYTAVSFSELDLNQTYDVTFIDMELIEENFSQLQRISSLLVAIELVKGKSIIQECIPTINLSQKDLEQRLYQLLYGGDYEN